VCLLTIAVNADPEWPLLLVANRDEFHARPTAPVAPWPDLPILGGRDLQAGGSWMALGNNNRFALVTNHRDARRQPPEGAPSRGTLVTEFILSQQSTQDFCQSLTAARAGFMFRGEINIQGMREKCGIERDASTWSGMRI